MRDLKEFTIPFVWLKLGEHHFDFTIDNKFFEHFEYYEFNAVAISLDVLLDKKTTFMEFTSVSYTHLTLPTILLV